jgi:hypothetical protein
MREENDMPLPTEKKKPTESLEDKIILLVGIPKIGKSTFASKFPDAYFLATEDGLRSIECFYDRIQTWEDFLKKVEELKENHPFKTIVIDTIDAFYDLCRDFVMKKQHIEHPSDLDYGKGWDILKGELRHGIKKLTDLNLGLIFISHSKVAEMQKKGSDFFTKITYTLPEHARLLFTALADIILFATFENGKRVIHTKPSEKYEAGDRTGRLPETISLDYSTLINAFYSSNSDEQITRQKLIMRIKKAEGVLSEAKIDGFEVEKRVMNSRKKHLTTEDIDQADVVNLQAYIQHLTLKFKESKKGVNNAPIPTNG